MKLTNISKIYQGRFLSYYIAEYELINGDIKKYEFMSRNNNLTIDDFGKTNPKGVGIIAFNEDMSKIALPSEFRLATNNWVINFPGGLIDDNETPTVAGIRELMEETGLIVTEVLDELKPAYCSQATSDETMYTIIVKCKGNITNSSFVDEENMVKWYTKEEVLKMVRDGVLMSARTQLFLYTWANDKIFS